MNKIFILLIVGILLLGCTQQGGGTTGGSSGGNTAGGNGGQVVGVGGTTGGSSGSSGGGSSGSSGGGSGSASPSGIVTIEQPEPGPEDVVVYIRNFQFEPRDVTIRQGRTIFWYNEDTTPHTVRSIGLFDSPYISKDGGPFWHTFTEDPGRYEYSCAIHGTMAGTITVVR